MQSIYVSTESAEVTLLICYVEFIKEKLLRWIFRIFTVFTLHKNWSFPLRIYLVNVTKSAGNYVDIATPNWHYVKSVEIHTGYVNLIWIKDYSGQSRGCQSSFDKDPTISSDTKIFKNKWENLTCKRNLESCILG